MFFVLDPSEINCDWGPSIFITPRWLHGRKADIWFPHPYSFPATIYPIFVRSTPIRVHWRHSRVTLHDGYSADFVFYPLTAKRQPVTFKRPISIFTQLRTATNRSYFSLCFFFQISLSPLSQLGEFEPVTRPRVVLKAESAPLSRTKNGNEARESSLKLHYSL